MQKENKMILSNVTFKESISLTGLGGVNNLWLESKEL
jgi:hypothetical protein